jgi:hypothetical protein
VLLDDHDDLRVGHLCAHRRDVVGSGGDVVASRPPIERVPQGVPLEFGLGGFVVRTRHPESAGIARRGRQNLNDECVQRATGVVCSDAQAVAQLRCHADEHNGGLRFAIHRRNLSPR